MYLNGQKFFVNQWDEDNARKEDGITVSEVHLRLGYWRKHPNLHGYIVRTFAAGVDECQKIDLDAVQNPASLPKTEGFFFGQSSGQPEEVAEDMKILERAIAWLETKTPNEMRSVSYQASW